MCAPLFVCLPFQHSNLLFDFTTLTMSTVSSVIIPVSWFLNLLQSLFLIIRQTRILKWIVGFVNSAGENPKQESKQDKGEIRVDNYPAWCRKTWARDWDRRFFWNIGIPKNLATLIREGTGVSETLVHVFVYIGTVLLIMEAACFILKRWNWSVRLHCSTWTMEATCSSETPTHIYQYT